MLPDQPPVVTPVARIDVFTLFPILIESFAATSVLGRASDKGIVDLRAHDLRSHGQGVHRTVDDAPFGGGAGMVLAPAPVFDCVEAASPPRPLFALGPGGRRFDQSFAHELAAQSINGGFSLLCGRYEGFDQRVHDHLTDGEISLGDFVLGGGEVAAMAIIEAVVRLVPGVMGNAASAVEESFSSGLLEYPQWTRPANFRGWEAPAVLRSGDHERISRWRVAQAAIRTATDRPDLLDARGGLTDIERRALAECDLLAEYPAPWGLIARAAQANEDAAKAAKRRHRKTGLRQPEALQTDGGHLP
jgi:tRNA (guanine37-N1)-methyltransferase